MTVLIPIERIKEGEKFFEPLNKEDFQLLVKSIQESGILQELIVKESKGSYTLLAGFNRLRAAKEVGLREVPCMVVPEKDMANAIFDTDLLRRQLTKSDVKKQLEVKKDYESKATYLIPKFESIKQYLPAKVLEVLSMLPLETQQKFANAIPQTIVSDEKQITVLQNKINYLEEKLEEKKKNRKTLVDVNKELKEIKEKYELLRVAKEKQYNSAVKTKTEEIEKEYKLEHTQEEIQEKIEEEKQKIEKQYEKEIDDLKKDAVKFSKLVKESNDKLIPLEEQIKSLKKEKKEKDDLANKYSLQDKISTETLKEFLSAESLPKRAEAIELQIEALAKNLNMFYDTLVRLTYPVVKPSKDDLKKPLANMSKSSKTFAQDLEKIQDFLK
jgi:ParB family chromosome partitioning protein